MARWAYILFKDGAGDGAMPSVSGMKFEGIVYRLGLTLVSLYVVSGSVTHHHSILSVIAVSVTERSRRVESRTGWRRLLVVRLIRREYRFLQFVLAELPRLDLLGLQC
jgi:hypothetical protein